ncbi:transcriptional regulator, AraC family [Actinacidiphila yanglinensis]|uniref:Transcriptional regulator, AraC family n=1 Tax=Actinacidiphila yanglinensis TaxID=310779 RepID=A0A1H5SNW8_9ACTN|nr:AraC family transcriptional regulator [Actinacidiphila yanglinensis]SEF51531.1 transcriptional regulator, AraC family [Actinacidiphila yanglinensis]
MDMVSEMVERVRIGHANGRLVKRSGAWGMGYTAFAGSGFHIVLSGGCWLVTSDGPATELTTGTVVLTPTGAAHGLSHAPCALDDLPPGVMGPEPEPSEPVDVEILCGAYRLEHGPERLFVAGLPDVIVVPPDHDRYPELRTVVDLLRADVSGTQPGSSASRRALLDLVLVHGLRQWLEQNRAPGLLNVTDPSIAAALHAIHADLGRRWTVQQLSQVAGLSRAAFTRRFTALVGRPPMAYLTEQRLTYAGRLLRETTAPLAAIAGEVGYATEFAFAAAFRRAFGVSPGRFRRPPAAAAGVVATDADAEAPVPSRRIAP